MKEIEMEGKTVTIAVEIGLKELGLRRDQVEVQVLEEGAAGFLGIGTKAARVLIREKRWGPDAPEPSEPPAVRPAAPRPSAAPRPCAPRSERPAHRPHTPRPERRAPATPAAEEVAVDTEKACATAEAVLKDLLPLLGVAAPSVRTLWDPEQARVRAEVETADAALLIGKGGKTLESLQFLVTVIAGRRMGTPVAVQVDSQGYWKRVEEKLLSDIRAAVEQVQQTGKPWRFDPMEPAMRRLIHRKLMNHPDVETASEGEGSWRKVVVKQRSKG